MQRWNIGRAFAGRENCTQESDEEDKGRRVLWAYGEGKESSTRRFY